MAGPVFKYSSDVKFNLRLRDFFVDFLACLVPGVIFVVFTTVLIVGFLLLLLYPLLVKNLDLLNVLRYLFVNLGFPVKFWAAVFFLFSSFFVGHLLYRQNPKHPDYASFCRVRKKIDLQEVWVIPDDKYLPQHVQFPYSNLQNYLKARGFDYLSNFISWLPGYENQRSKTFINKLKIRINFFYPDKMLNIVKNEAHIRLASSMWYCSKYIINLAYWILGFLGIYLFFLLIPKTGFFSLIPEIKTSIFSANILLPVFLLLLLFIFYHFPYYYLKYLKDGEKNKESESSESKSSKKISQTEKSYKLVDKIDGFFLYRDRFPLLISFLFLILSYSLCFNFDRFDVPFDQKILFFVFIYSCFLFLILLGATFSKHKIEQSLHYQRVREIIYVLETAYIARLLSEEDVKELWERLIASDSKSD